MRYGPRAQWQNFGFAFCGRWFDLQWGISRYTLLMRPNNVETAVQVHSGSVCRTQVFAEFSGHGNSIYNIIPLLKKVNVKNIYQDCFYTGDPFLQE